MDIKKSLIFLTPQNPFWILLKREEDEKMKKKRGLSPVISTVLLIMIVLILAAIIILWARGFIKEKVLKFDKPIENVCTEVSIKTFINDDDSFGFTNIGNVPIYAIDLKISGGGSSDVYKIQEKVDAGYSFVFDDQLYTYDPTKEFKIIPILIGKTKDGGVKEFSCPERAGFVV